MREGEIREDDVGFELLDDSGEDWVGEAVVGVAERGFEGPDVLGGDDRKAEAEAVEAKVGFWDEEEEGLEREVAMKERTEAMVKKRRGAGRMR
ncbi:hypothetical protein ACFX15_034005 [Malus domestica]